MATQNREQKMDEVSDKLEAERVVLFGRVRVEGILGGSWDLVSEVINTLIGVISIVTLIITLVTKSHDPLSRYQEPKACLVQISAGTIASSEKAFSMRGPWRGR